MVGDHLAVVVATTYGASVVSMDGGGVVLVAETVLALVAEGGIS